MTISVDLNITNLNMHRFIGTKIVWARPMTRADAESHLRRDIGGTATGDGYLVRYADGYESWSPRDAFDEAYRPTSFLTFGLALEAMRKGLHVARAGWNGRGMWICLMPALYLPSYTTLDTARKVNDRTAKHIGANTPLDSQPYIAMWTAEGKWQPGWLASQADILGDDWYVLPSTGCEGGAMEGNTTAL